MAEAKRQKIDESPHYLCTSCNESKPESEFPDFNPNSACDHSINTCAACLKLWVTVNIKNNQTVPTGDHKELLGIPCPECPLLMLEMDIQIATNLNMLARFLKLQKLHQRNNTPDWRWCLEPKCKSGQIHKDDDSELFDIRHMWRGGLCAMRPAPAQGRDVQTVQGSCQGSHG